MLLILFITNLMLLAESYEDVIYLKNGSVIRGIIIEQVPNKTIKIKTKDRNIFVYKLEEVLKITKEEIEPISSSGLKEGYKGVLTLGYQIGVGEKKYDRVKLVYSGGFQYNPYISFGITSGLNYYLRDYSFKVLIPILIDFKTNFTDSDISPFISISVGTSLNPENSFNIFGPLFEISVGADLITSKSSTFNIGLGYRLQQSNLNYDNIIQSSDFPAIGLFIGYTF